MRLETRSRRAEEYVDAMRRNVLGRPCSDRQACRTRDRVREIASKSRYFRGMLDLRNLRPTLRTNSGLSATRSGGDRRIPPAP